MTRTPRQPFLERVVVVSGTRRGLGRSLAQHFLGEGAVVVGLSRGEATLDHPRYEHHAVDIGIESSVRGVLLEVGRRHGRVDIAVNNAGVVSVRHALVTPSADIDEMVRTNLLGTFYVSREAAKIMRRRSWGRVINIGSIASALSPVGEAMYAATKSAIGTLGEVLAKEFASYGITVNTVAVTAVKTDMLDQLPHAAVVTLLASLPIPRLATMADVINVVDFYASPASDYVTAQTIYLGGIHA